jgi:transposase-like protein
VQNFSDKSKCAYKRYDLNLKRHLASMCCEPGASVAAIAREHGINANMLFMWRKQYALSSSIDSAVLLPVEVEAEVGQPEKSRAITRSSPRTVHLSAAKHVMGLGSCDGTIKQRPMHCEDVTFSVCTHF